MDTNLARVYAKAIEMVVDTGYTKICHCGKRHGVIQRLVGRERELRIEECEKCSLREKTISPENHAFGSRV